MNATREMFDTVMEHIEAHAQLMVKHDLSLTDDQRGTLKNGTCCASGDDIEY